MIKKMLELLNSNDWYIGDEDIDIAKGKYQAPTNLKEVRKSIKRNTYSNGE